MIPRCAIMTTTTIKVMISIFLRNDPQKTSRSKILIQIKRHVLYFEIFTSWIGKPDFTSTYPLLDAVRWYTPNSLKKVASLVTSIYSVFSPNRKKRPNSVLSDTSVLWGSLGHFDDFLYRYTPFHLECHLHCTDHKIRSLPWISHRTKQPHRPSAVYGTPLITCDELRQRSSTQKKEVEVVPVLVLDVYLFSAPFFFSPPLTL